MRKPAIVLAMACLGVFLVHAQNPSPQDLRRYERQAAAVNIIHDQWGVPHIYGKTDADAVFGLLYEECRTDFRRVEQNYLMMLGRQAEAMGERYLTNDIMMRLIYDSAQAVRDYQQSPAWMRRLLDAFADGVNYYLYKHPETRPQVLRHFEPWYPLMFTDGSVSATSMGGVRAEEVRKFYDAQKDLPSLGILLPFGGAGHRESRSTGSSPSGKKKARPLSEVEKMVLADRGMLGPGDADTPVAVFHPGADSVIHGNAVRDSLRKDSSRHGQSLSEEGRDAIYNGAEGGWAGFDDIEDRGSNGFAIAPSRSASGHALLYINPHVPFYFRMEAHIVSGEGLDAYGAVTWGQFFIYQGFNAHCGWMHTSSYADVADLYEEKVIRHADGWSYTYDGHELPVTARPFVVYCRKGDSTEVLHYTGYYTGHGPVMTSREGKWISLKEYNRSPRALQEAWLITRAGNFAEYRKAMELRANTTNNTVYADDRGNIAYWHGNFMPRRDTGYNWTLPVDGTVAATAWKGLHELDEIVHLYNPASGWIQNCNSTPFAASGSSSPVRSQYPAYMAPDGQNFRALNAISLLDTARALTLDALIAKGYDHYLSAFDLLIPALKQAYDQGSGFFRDSLREQVDLLVQWDRRSAVSSVATTLAIEWATRMTRFAPRTATSEEGTRAVDNLHKELANTSAAQMLGELVAVINDLRQRFGDWRISWGDLNRYQRLTGNIDERYSDDSVSLASGMAPSQFGALPSFVSRTMPGTRKRYGYSGNSFIAAVEFGPRLHARTIITGGQSSDPHSPHFTDQAAGYLEGKFKEINFYRDDVLRAKQDQYQPGKE